MGTGHNRAKYVNRMSCCVLKHILFVYMLSIVMHIIIFCFVTCPKYVVVFVCAYFVGHYVLIFHAYYVHMQRNDQKDNAASAKSAAAQPIGSTDLVSTRKNTKRSRSVNAVSEDNTNKKKKKDANHRSQKDKASSISKSWKRRSGNKQDNRKKKKPSKRVSDF